MCRADTSESRPPMPAKTGGSRIVPEELSSLDL